MEISGMAIVMGLIMGVVTLLVYNNKEKAEAPKCPQCLGTVNVGAIKCVNCGSDISG